MPPRRSTNSKANKQRTARGSKTQAKEHMDLHPALMPLPALTYGFPQKMYTKLRYADAYSLTSTAGSIAKQVITWNSTFDPDYTGVGHQPLYRDTYAAIYDQYAVVKARITVTFCSNAATSAMLCGIVTDDDATSSTLGTVLIEQSRGKHLLLPNNGGSISSREIVLDWDAEQHLNIDPFSSELYKTAIGANPTESSFAHIWAVPADASSSTVTQILVVLEQWVLWTELSTPSSS
jgi:hypothetical protein